MTKRGNTLITPCALTRRVSRGQASTRMSRARSDHATYQPNMYYPDRARRTRLARPSPPKASALAPHFESTQPCRVWVRVAGVRMLARRARPEAPWSRRALSPRSPPHEDTPKQQPDKKEKTQRQAARQDRKARRQANRQARRSRR